VPIIPIFDIPLLKLSLNNLMEHIAAFVERKNFSKVHVLGNSLGGHIALLYALAYPKRIASLTLTGSSGLYESAMGSTYPKRSDYNYIKQKTEDTFFNPEVATKELVDEVFDTVNDKNKAIRVLITAKSAIRHNLREKLMHIKLPTLLIWGKDDKVTPAYVGDEFHKRIEGSKLFLLENCGHAPMMEHPQLFNMHLENFLMNLKEKGKEVIV
jgi:pimeloyl-ACP methyl ester carboxylesterase